MPYYEYQCKHGSKYEHWFEMGEAARTVTVIVDSHQCEFARVFSFNHVEDRRHMRTGISRTTGREFAKSRTEERAVEKELGIEFIGKSDVPQKWNHLAEYNAHVKAGGERIDPHEINPEPFDSTKASLIEKAAERGITLGS